MADLDQARRRYLKPKDNPGCAYAARRGGDGTCVVTAGGRSLPPRLDLWNHSPAGFGWGYGGSGPAQLALALLAHALEDDDLAVRLHQHYKAAFLVSYPGLEWGGWEVSRRDVWERAMACAPDEHAKMIGDAIEKIKEKERVRVG